MAAARDYHDGEIDIMPENDCRWRHIMITVGTIATCAEHRHVRENTPRRHSIWNRNKINKYLYQTSKIHGGNKRAGRRSDARKSAEMTGRSIISRMWHESICVPKFHVATRLIHFVMTSNKGRISFSISSMTEAGGDALTRRDSLEEWW